MNQLFHFPIADRLIALFCNRERDSQIPLWMHTDSPVPMQDPPIPKEPERYANTSCKPLFLSLRIVRLFPGLKISQQPVHDILPE
jgi:hypothetical protein